jgi:L-asparaginase
MGHHAETVALEPLDFNHLVDSMPEFKLIKTEIDVYQFTPPSTPATCHLRNGTKLVRIISRNYNDTTDLSSFTAPTPWAYTASALSFMLENLTKPVILTGSQLPIGQLRTDGKENLDDEHRTGGHEDAWGQPACPRCVSTSADGCARQPLYQDQRRWLSCLRLRSISAPCDAGVNFSFHPHHILTPRLLEA